MRSFSSSTFSRYRAATYPVGYQPSGTVPSQRFARSQGFTPPSTCRPCFMPVPSMRFYPSRSNSTRRAVHPLRCPFPLVVARQLLSTSSVYPPIFQERILAPIHLYREVVAFLSHSTTGLYSLRMSVLPKKWFRPLRESRPSWAFPSLGGSPSSPDHPGGSSHELVPRRAC